MSSALSLADLSTIKDVVVPLAAEVGRWARGESEAYHLGLADVGVSTKTSPGDVVTRVDLESQRRIAERLKAAYPTFGLLGEEGGLADYAADEPVWIIDPVDGTHNFVRGYPSFCVSIGLVQGGESVLGAIYDAGVDSVTWAVEGGGAWSGGKRLELDEGRPLSHALVTTNFTEVMRHEEAYQRFFSRMAGAAAGVRASGSACRDFCFVAQGTVDLFWQFGLRAWDVAAGAVIVREAGGAFELWGAQTGESWLRGELTVAAGTRNAVAHARRVADKLGLLAGARS